MRLVELMVVVDEYRGWSRCHELLVDLLLDTVRVDDQLKGSSLERNQFCALGELQLAVGARMDEVVRLLSTMSHGTDSRSGGVTELARRIAAAKQVVEAVTKRLSESMEASSDRGSYEQAAAWHNKAIGGVGLSEIVLTDVDNTEDEVSIDEGGGEGEDTSKRYNSWTGMCGDCERKFSSGERGVVCEHDTWEWLVPSFVQGR